MAGTKAGGAKAAITNNQRYGKDFYPKIGKKGADAWNKRNKKGIAKPRGFAANPELASKAGRVGGTISRRTKQL